MKRSRLDLGALLALDFDQSCLVVRFNTMKTALMCAAATGLFFSPISMVQAQSGVPKVRDFPTQNTEDPGEKRSRSFSQQKIDSQLLQAARLRRQGQAITKIDALQDGAGRVEVDISAEVTDTLLLAIHNEGGQVISSYPQFKSVRAYLTLESLEIIARLSEVRVISRAAKAELSGANSTIGGQVPRSPTSRNLKQGNTSRRPASTTHKRRKKRRRHTS